MLIFDKQTKPFVAGYYSAGHCGKNVYNPGLESRQLIPCRGRPDPQAERLTYPPTIHRSAANHSRPIFASYCALTGTAIMLKNGSFDSPSPCASPADPEIRAQPNANRRNRLPVRTLDSPCNELLNIMVCPQLDGASDCSFSSNAFRAETV